jgi:hypothetical protein
MVGRAATDAIPICRVHAFYFGALQLISGLLIGAANGWWYEPLHCLAKKRECILVTGDGFKTWCQNVTHWDSTVSQSVTHSLTHSLTQKKRPSNPSCMTTHHMHQVMGLHGVTWDSMQTNTFHVSTELKPSFTYIIIY